MNVASAVHRLAVLLEAGVAPTPAWRYLAEADAAESLDADSHTGVIAAAAAAESVDDIALAIVSAASGSAEGAAWRGVAAAWRVASGVGAPLGPTLTRLAEVVHDVAESRRDVDVAMAGPRATGRIVLVLPFLGLGFGALMGFDTLHVLFGTIPGLLCVLIGTFLLLLGRRWTRRLLRVAREIDPTPGLGLELLGIALSGGVSPERAREIVDDALHTCGLSPVSPAADGLLEFSRAAGIPIAALLRGEAREERRAARASVRRRSAELGTRLLLPLGLCVLPSFLALGVAPLLVAVLSSTIGFS
jgi:tight adherence protein B